LSATIDYKTELYRKSIHLLSLSIPIGYFFLSKEIALSLLLPLTIIFLVVDTSKFIYPRFYNSISKLFSFMLREHEKNIKKKTLNGASWVLISATLTLLVFPKIIFISAFSILIISDISAALIGRKFGKHKFLFKSLEGSLAFFFSAIIVVLIAPKVDNLLIEYLIGFAGAFVGMFAENLSYGWADDNLTIPFSVGGLMWLLYSLVLPNLL